MFYNIRIEIVLEGESLMSTVINDLGKDLVPAREVGWKWGFLPILVVKTQMGSREVYTPKTGQLRDTAGVLHTCSYTETPDCIIYWITP
jgi:hypothetical protein